MLKESEEILKKIRFGNTKLSRKNRFKLWFSRNRKKIKYISLFILLFFVLFFPQFVGALIGNWVVDFIGTMVKIIGSGF